MVREDRILSVLDEWLFGMLHEDRLEVLVEEILAADSASVGEEPDTTAARRSRTDACRRIEKYLDGLEAGVDPLMIADRMRQAKADIVQADAVIATAAQVPRRAALEPSEVKQALRAIKANPALLDGADRSARADLYRVLKLSFTYHQENDREFVRVSGTVPPVDFVRVEGGSQTMSTHEIRIRILLAPATG